MQAELVYYGHFGDLRYFDELPWGHFMFFYKWLADVKKKEKEAQEKAKKEQEAAMASAKARGRRRR